MKLWLIFALFGLINLPLAAQELLIGMEGKFPPFEEVDAKGNLKGFNVDIANALCAQMKAQCKIVRFAWGEQIPALKARKVDAILSSMSITEERLKEVDFTAKYTQIPAYFFTKEKRVPYAYITPKRIEKMRIGVQEGTTYDHYISAKYQATSPVVRYKNSNLLYEGLIKGEVDLVMDDVVAGYYGFLQSPRGKGFELAGSAVVDEKFFGIGQGIALRKGDYGLQERLNKALAAILENGVYKEIQRRYFVFNVY